MDMEHPIEVSPTGDMTLQLSARMLSFGLQADPASLEFGSASVGYTQPEGQEQTFTNNGEMPMMIATDGVENYEATLLDGPEDGVLEVGESMTILVKPRADLPAGVYDDTSRHRECGSALHRV